MNKIDYAIESLSSPQDFIKQLDDKMYEFNSKATRKEDGDYFCKIIRDGNGNLIAGICGWTWASACEIMTLWVEEGFRKKGLGEKLLRAAESEAIQKKCNTILVRSYSFQAPFFYQGYGYKPEYVLDNFPDGYQYYILVKRIG